MRLLNMIANYFAQNGKYSVLNYLRQVPESRLIEMGYSPTLIREGITAWPWREDQEPEYLQQIEKILSDEKVHIKALQHYSDADLADLGIPRGQIKEAVRHGRPGIDKQTSIAA